MKNKSINSFCCTYSHVDRKEVTHPTAIMIEEEKKLEVLTYTTTSTRVPSPRSSPPGQLNLILRGCFDIIFLTNRRYYSRALKATHVKSMRDWGDISWRLSSLAAVEGLVGLLITS